MCEHGRTVDVQVTVDATLSYEGVDTVKTKPIDACIASLVAAFEAGGTRMLGSCCGHGKAPGEIVLADGRLLTITQGA